VLVAAISLVLSIYLSQRIVLIKHRR